MCNYSFAPTILAILRQIYIGIFMFIHAKFTRVRMRRCDLRGSVCSRMAYISPENKTAYFRLHIYTYFRNRNVIF